MANDASAPSIETPTTSETIELLLDRRSVRSIAPDPIPEAQVEAVLRAAFRRSVARGAKGPRPGGCAGW